MAKESISKKDIALSCRHIWKVYGEKPEQFFSQGNGAVNTPKEYANTIQNSNHIVANADVSFDVYNGEIFVIMGLSGSGNPQLFAVYQDWLNLRLVILSLMVKIFSINQKRS